MRILLAAKYLPGESIGGVQSWVTTVARRFQECGHDVTICGPRKRPKPGRYDLGILAHIQATAFALPLCRRFVNVSHGIVREEKPDRNLRLIYTSEEVERKWKWPGDIIRQPIDTDFWHEDGARKRDALVFYSYRSRSSLQLEQTANALGLRFQWIRDAAPDEARDALQSAALVCASGRAALEAMACNAPTLIMDDRDYNGGPLVCADMTKAREHNYSGRGGVHPDKVNVEQIAKETMHFQRPRAYVEEFHDYRFVADELLAVCLQS